MCFIRYSVQGLETKGHLWITKRFSCGIYRLNLFTLHSVETCGQRIKTIVQCI